jgi:predicted SAM-dependent methyltransferase
MKELNVVVGARTTTYPDWISTDLRSSEAPPLDIRREEDWRYYFAPGSIDKIVCEHCLEHMSFEDGFKALSNFRKFLKPGGFARIAVPDAYNPNPLYQAHVRPGGPVQLLARLFLYARDEPPHQVHYDYRTLSELISRADLEPILYEYFDGAGHFRVRRWDKAAAPIRRYYGSPYNLKVFERWCGFQSLSIIVDAKRS